METEKILFFTLEPFSPEHHITEDVKALLPVESIFSVRELSPDSIDPDDVDEFSCIVSTVGVERNSLKDPQGHGRYVNERNEIDFDARDYYLDPEEGPEEWAESVEAALNHIMYEHVYEIVAAISDTIDED